MDEISRVRMFAGPNGSGKSTMKSAVPPHLLKLFVNPDEEEKDARSRGYFDAAAFGIEPEREDILNFFRDHPLIRKADLTSQVRRLLFKDGLLHLNDVVLTSYWAAVWADYLRRKLVESRLSFSFETVMSSPDKVEFLRMARSRGYRTYLYFVATDDPEINVTRVQLRHSLGGHDVPEDKIRTRYERSLDLLRDAISHCDRAFLFDNSGRELVNFAEFEGSETWQAKSTEIPLWFKRSVLDKEYS